MKDETRPWLSFADENLEMSRLALEHGHLNACLQNAQQAVEKYLKAVIVERNLDRRRTHNIRELVGILAAQQISLDVSGDEIDLMDAIYVPSKYPDYSALPETEPDSAVCTTALEVAQKVRAQVGAVLRREETEPPGSEL